MRSLRFWRALHVDGWAALLLTLALGGLVLCLGGTPQFTARTLWAPVLATVLGMLSCRLCGRPALQGLSEWWPFLLMIGLYMQMDPYTSLLHPESMDLLLHLLDVRLFGVAPTLFLQRFTHPVLTEIMALGYSSYFVLPLLTAAPVYIPTIAASEQRLMRHRDAFREILTAQVLALGLGFIGYVLCPARGPRYFLAAHYQAPLHGAFHYYDWAIDLWNRMQEVHCDAFPSLHTATGVVSLYFGCHFRRYFRPLPFIVTPLAVMLICSTLYLRMHYVVDVMAGVAVGLCAVGLSRLAMKRVTPRT